MPTPPKAVRFFCPTYGGAQSELAAAYADMLVAAGVHVRVVGTRAFSASAPEWVQRRDLLLAPLSAHTETTLNLVMGAPVDWQRLWTKGMRNVLIATALPPARDEMVSAMEVTGIRSTGERETHRTEAGNALVAAARFDLVLVSDLALRDAWVDALGTATSSDRRTPVMAIPATMPALSTFPVVAQAFHDLLFC